MNPHTYSISHIPCQCNASQNLGGDGPVQTHGMCVWAIPLLWGATCKGDTFVCKGDDVLSTELLQKQFMMYLL